ncbi:MAG: ABC transporter substrate-binding protein [Alphaproteobacteria bacterium]|nr:ABC transporter substrate-binding protein [Alphaproteobacteria bacterium]
MTDTRMWRRALSGTVAIGLLTAAVAAVPITANAANPPDTLRVGVNAKTPARGNPFVAGFSIPSVYYWSAIFDSLTRVSGKGENIPNLAQSWSVGADKLTWTFKLRSDVKFTNGEPMNADALVATYKYLLFDEKGKISTITANIKNVEDVAKVDEFTITLKTKTPEPIFAGTVATIGIVAPKAWIDMGPVAYANQPAGTGPYRAVSWSDQEAQFVLNPGSHRPGKVPRITIIEVPEVVARAQALLSEQIDISTNMGPEDLIKIRAAGHQADIAGSPNIMAIALFTEDFSPNKKWGDKGTPFRDKRVRQAMNYVVDRESIIKNLVGGLTKPASQPANPGTFGYNPDVKPYPVDFAKAKQLLTEAGYGNGFKFTSEVLTGFSPNDKEIWTFIADSAAKVGIQMELRPIPFSDWLTKYVQGKWEGESTTLSFLVEPHMDAIRPFQNYSCLLSKTAKAFTCVQEHMPLIDQASSEMDPVKREKLLKDLMKLSADEAIAIPIQENVEIAGLNKRVKGFVNWNKVLLYENITLQN